ncbi:MAG: hypothetical protein GX601_10725 [Anaerolineales bacterium]|nr:hypothetical protein [Anaerolineales bacterium]
MNQMTHRERILAIVQGRELDRVPFITYDSEPPRIADVMKTVGPERIGLLRWSAVHRELHPHCVFETEPYTVGETRCERRTLHTPVGAIYEERAFEPGYGSSAIRKHYVQEPEDYEVLWAYLEDCVILEDYNRYHRDAAELGEQGLPLVAVERTPYQQLWIQWVGLDTLPYHIADYPERVAHTVELLEARARTILELAVRSPAPFIDFPDNITAPAIGPRRFRETCLPLYATLAEMLGGQNRAVYVHMDGDLRLLWEAISESRVDGIDSFSPAPENDTSVAQAVEMWPHMRLWVNFPSSVHIQPYEVVRAVADNLLAQGGHTGRMQLQISENVPLAVWPVSFTAIADAIDAFGKP